MKVALCVVLLFVSFSQECIANCTKCGRGRGRGQGREDAYSDAPSDAPSDVPSSIPTKSPYNRNLTPAPSNAPTSLPTSSPTQSPSGAPTTAPTQTPTGAPTSTPTKTPTGTPTSFPTCPPTVTPVRSETPRYGGEPTAGPSDVESDIPTMVPTTTYGGRTERPRYGGEPTPGPSDVESDIPTMVPTTTYGGRTERPRYGGEPTPGPSDVESDIPTMVPTTTYGGRTERPRYGGEPTPGPSDVESDIPTMVPTTTYGGRTERPRYGGEPTPGPAPTVPGATTTTPTMVVPSCPPTTYTGGGGRTETPRYGGEPTLEPAPTLRPRTRTPTSRGGGGGVTQPTVEPTSASSTPGRSITCGCKECTSNVLDQVVEDAGGSYSCRDRIKFLINVDEFTESEACSRVSDEFPDTCGRGCDPQGECSPPVVSDCGCPTCTNEILDLNATDAGGTYTCRERMNFLMAEYGNSETSACARVSREFPDICAPACDPDLCGAEAPTTSPGRGGYPLPPTAPRGVVDCGCPDTCDQDVLNRMAGSFTCKDRINWVILDSGLRFDERQACIVLNNEFPSICTCNPRNCTESRGVTSDMPSDVPSLSPTVTPSPTITTSPTVVPTVSASPTTSLYRANNGTLASEMTAMLEDQGAVKVGETETANENENDASFAQVMSTKVTLVMGLLSLGVILF